MRAPLPISFLFPRSNFPLPLFHLPCPRCYPVDGCRRSLDPKVSFPSPLLSPSSFPLPHACPPHPAHCTRPSLAPPRASCRDPWAWPLGRGPDVVRRGPQHGAARPPVRSGEAHRAWSPAQYDEAPRARPRRGSARPWSGTARPLGRGPGAPLALAARPCARAALARNI
jgi:hypothetical protein